MFAAPDRRLIFGVNDFDETLPGPFEWDVKRLVASFAVAGRDRGFAEHERHAVNLSAARAYRMAMLDFAGARTSMSGTPASRSTRSQARWASGKVRARDLKQNRTQHRKEGAPRTTYARSVG